MAKDLKRTLGFRSLLAVAVGLVVSQGVMTIMLQGAGFAGYGFFIAIFIGYSLTVCCALTFSELSLMFPSAGSLSVYTQKAIGHFPAIMAVYSGYVVIALLALSAELIILDLLIASLFPDIFPPLIIAFTVLIALTIMNVLGVDIFAKIQSVLAYAMIVALLILSLTALFGIGAPRPTDIQMSVELNPMGWGVFTLAALAAWGFIGSEFVCPLIEEAKEPEKNIPKAMIAGLTIIFVVHCLYCAGALLYVPQETLISSGLPHLEYAKAVFGDTGILFLAIAAITATCSTVNSTLAAVPRMLYGMAENKQTFSIFKQLHSKYQTPWIAIIFIAAITGIPMLIYGSSADTILLLLSGGAISWLVAYIIANIDVMVLRKKYPMANRPFKTPFYPLPQILGILGMLYAIYYAPPTPEMAKDIFTIAGSVLLFGAILSALWVKIVMKKGLFEVDSFD